MRRIYYDPDLEALVDGLVYGDDEEVLDLRTKLHAAVTELQQLRTLIDKAFHTSTKAMNR